MLTRPRSITRVILAVFLLLALGGLASAQELKSPALAKELATALDAAKLTAIAAKDGPDQESYVAAMYFSGSQLLVVAAKYNPSILLSQKLDRKEYQEIYIDLNSAAVAGTKIFIEDPGADGLKAEHKDGEAPDTIERANKRTMFDSSWRKEQKLEDAAYMKLVTDTDELYARLLRALIAQSKK